MAVVAIAGDHAVVVFLERGLNPDRNRFEIERLLSILGRPLPETHRTEHFWLHVHARRVSNPFPTFEERICSRLTLAINGYQMQRPSDAPAPVKKSSKKGRRR